MYEFNSGELQDKQTKCILACDAQGTGLFKGMRVKVGDPIIQ